MRAAYQASSHRIFHDVFDFSREVFCASHCPIKGLVLPKTPFATQIFVDPVSGRTLDPLHDLLKWNFEPFFCHRRNHQVDMVGHDNYGVEMEQVAIPCVARL
jgi:hypothetical protein